MSLEPPRSTGIALVLVLLVATPVLLQATAQEPTDEPRRLNLIAHNAGDVYWFESDDAPGRNPKLTLRPGEPVELTLENRGSVQHNIHVGAPINESTRLLDPAIQETLRFTPPDDAEGDTKYWCDPHRSLGMIGTTAFGEPPPVNLDLAAPSVAGALVAVAGLLVWAQRGRARAPGQR